MFRKSPWPLILATLLCTCGFIPRLIAQERPNILFFLSDDHRWDRLGVAGHPILRTPNIDALANEGVRFSNTFVTTSICAASRATILTGLYERTHGYTFGTPPISEEHAQATYPALLKKNGYRTGFIGKFGVNLDADPMEVMFDYMQLINRNPYFHKMPDGSLRHESDLAGDRAIEFLESCSQDQPFCLSVSFNAAHAEDSDKRPGIGHYPWPPSVDGLYEDVRIPEPKYSDPAIFEAHPQFMKESMNRDRFFWRWDTPEKFQTNVRAYYRMITGLDKVIGQVLEDLERKGFADNTIVIFSGDNGYYEGQRGFAGKWSHYEESLRVPLVIYDPRAPEKLRGRVDEHMALNADIPPTILDYAGVDIPEHYQGRTLVPLMRGESPAQWRDDTFVEHLMDNADIPKWEGVRGSRYVYARYFEQDPPYEYLHDLEADPDQLTNFASNPEYAPVLDRMRERTDELRGRYGGEFDAERLRVWKEEQAAKRKSQPQQKRKQVR